MDCEKTTLCSSVTLLKIADEDRLTPGTQKLFAQSLDSQQSAALPEVSSEAMSFIIQ